MREEIIALFNDDISIITESITNIKRMETIGCDMESSKYLRRAKEDMLIAEEKNLSWTIEQRRKYINKTI